MSITQYQNSSKDVLSTVNFGGHSTADLISVVNFVGPTAAHTDFLSNITFFVPGHSDQKSYVNFALGGNYTDFPSNVHFYTNSDNFDVLSSVTFFTDTDFLSNVHFIQNSDDDFLSNIIFKIPHDILSTVLFFQKNEVDTLSYVFLGRYIKDILSKVSFIQNGFKDFTCSITIAQSNVQETLGNYQSTQDFTASIQILGLATSDTLSQVVFFVPPFSRDFLSNINFIQKAITDFSASITIRNPYLGVSGATVGNSEITNEVSHELPKDITQSVVLTDAMGYFSINNLSPGTYTIAPVIDGVVCEPPSYVVEITNANVYLYFGVDSSLINQLIPKTINSTNSIQNNNHTVCYVRNDVSSTPGTFSIEGFIKFYEGDYTDIITIISDTTKRDRYLGTLYEF